MGLVTKGLGGQGLISQGIGWLKEIIEKIVERVTGIFPRIKRGVPFKVKFPYFGKGQKLFSESKRTIGMTSVPFVSVRKAKGSTGLSFKNSLPIISKTSKEFLSSIKYSGKTIQGLSQTILVKGKKSFKFLDKLIDFLFEEELEDQ